MKIRKTAIYTSMICALAFVVAQMISVSQSASGECVEKLEGEQCHANAGTYICSLAFPSYDDECLDETSLQIKELDTYWHWPESIGPGEWGLSNIVESTTSETVCSQARPCVFTAGVEPIPDMCVATGSFTTFWGKTAYDWDDECQSPEQ